MAFDNLLVGRDGSVASVTINRPSVLNALDTSTLEQLGRAFDDCRSDPAIRAVVLTGAGDKAFVAGADIRLDAVHRGGDLPLADGCALEASLFALAAATDDMREGTRAFLEKRTPSFSGR